jgi:dihydropteroate synthase
MKIAAERNSKLEFDSNGFFIILIDKQRKKIIAEHYLNVEKGKLLATGKLDRIIEGDDAESISHTISKLGLVSSTDHAMYLGRELQKAEIALKAGTEYEQE